MFESGEGGEKGGRQIKMELGRTLQGVIPYPIIEALGDQLQSVVCKI